MKLYETLFFRKMWKGINTLDVLKLAQVKKKKKKTKKR